MVLSIITLAWAILIFYLSTEPFGSAFSRSILARELSIFHLTVSSTTFRHLDTLQRKVAHLIAYGVFAALLYGALGGEDSNRGRIRLAFWCVVMAGGYSLTDEFHQLFVRGRNASLVDCGIDIAGAAIALTLVYNAQQFLRRTSGRRSFQKAPRETVAE